MSILVDQYSRVVIQGITGGAGRFHAEQMLDFLVFWRVLVPVVLGGLIIVFALANNFLSMRNKIVI